MVPSNATIAVRELQRQELLAYADQQRLADLACAGTRCTEPHEAIATTILALVHRLTAFMSLALRERPSPGPAATASDSPSPFIAPRG